MPRRGETAVVPIDADGRGHGGPKSAHGHRPRPPQQQFRPFRPWFPFLVPLFVAANVGFFALSMYVNDCPAHAAAADAALGGAAEAPGCLLQSDLGRFAFQPYRENPLIGPSSATLLEMGALETSKVAKDHEWWRLITCIWLHAGVVHILANMLSLLLIGMRLETEFGFLRIGTLYLISGVGGSLLSALFMVSNISVGASGALFGLLGSMLSELITNWTIYENKCAALLTLVVIIALNLAVGILPHVDNFAHIGGFVSGFFLGFVLLMRPQYAYINQKNSPLGSPRGKS
uniref:Uncharacterized protein n=1 Tax=Avena sativa TaxID=4498 RepID=A0ACD5VKF7_AVESA